MQIHEITEAVRPPVKTGLAQQSQQRNTPVVPAQAQSNPTKTTPGAGAFGQMANTLRTYAPPETTSTGGTLTQTTNGQVHKANPNNPNIGPVIATTPAGQSPAQQVVAKKSNIWSRVNNAAHGVADYFLHKNPALYSVPYRNGLQNQLQSTREHPAITVGSGPTAQVYVHNGRNYVDQSTGNLMPPTVAKSMGLK